MRILICGATGFIGRNIAQHFSAMPDTEVIGVYNKREPFDLPGLSWVQADLTNQADVARVVEGTDIIIQAAATTSGSRDIITRPYIHVTDNAVMNSLLFRSAFEHKVKHVIFFSCTVMYPSSDRPLKETDYDANAELNPRYFGSAWTKVYIEKQCEFYAQLGITKYTVIRHSNIYGPHDKFDLERSHVFGATVTKVLTAQDGKITVWGSGEEGRDLLYVDDLMNMVALSLKNQEQPFKLYNVGAGRAVTINELVNKIIAASGQRISIEHDLSMPTIPTTLCIDCTEVRNELGWQPEVSLEYGIAKTVAWWRDNVGLK